MSVFMLLNSSSTNGSKFEISLPCVVLFLDYCVSRNVIKYVVIVHLIVVFLIYRNCVTLKVTDFTFK